jgi:hypothetical protein
MEVDDVEVVRLPQNRFQGQDLVRHRILAARIEAQSLAADRDQAGAGVRITAREQRHVVSELDQMLGQVRHDPFSTAIEARRHGLLQWSNLRDTHGPASLVKWRAGERQDPAPGSRCVR